MKINNRKTLRMLLGVMSLVNVLAARSYALMCTCIVMENPPNSMYFGYQQAYWPFDSGSCAGKNGTEQLWSSGPTLSGNNGNFSGSLYDGIFQSFPLVTFYSCVSAS